jgi:beta-phosphoglucomutase
MLRAVIFDMDGVLVRSDEYHYGSWRRLADEYGIPFTRATFDGRMRGLQRWDALAVFLETDAMDRPPTIHAELADKKNAYFHELLLSNPPEPVAGVIRLIRELRGLGIKLAVGSSSRNAVPILQATGLMQAAAGLEVAPADCVVIEDAVDGVQAARNAHMAVVAIGPPDRFDPQVPRVDSLDEITTVLLSALAAR